MATGQHRGRPQTQTITYAGMSYLVRVWTDAPGVTAGGRIEIKRRSGDTGTEQERDQDHTAQAARDGDVWTFAVVDRSTVVCQSSNTADDVVAQPTVPTQIRGVLRELGFTAVTEGTDA